MFAGLIFRIKMEFRRASVAASMLSVQLSSKGGPVQCPRCRTARLRILKKRDGIDTMYGNFLLNRWRVRRGDTLYHCIFCRLQFYDPRKPKAGPRVEAPGKAVPESEPAGEV